MFADKMKMSDGFGLKIECGHPNTQPGRECRLCGVIVEAQPPAITEENKEAK